ncbi:MAG: EVE domain-containing protein [Bacillota bacterium]|jgi:hypothetical protein
MNYIFVVNDLRIGSTSLSGVDIVDELLEKELWVYSYNAPLVNRLRVDDRVLVYIAGPRHRWFEGSFRIAGNVTAGRRPVQLNPILERMFPLWSPIREIQRWSRPVPAIEVIPHLEFIKDKRYWGLHFRQSVKQINDRDYELIVALAAKA